MEVTLKKKGAWKVDDIITCLDAYIENHEKYKSMRKSGQAKSFHEITANNLCRIVQYHR